ncbi:MULTISPECIES: prepilin peptidase [Prochlorococcus]|nr:MULTISPECIES: prepilin peptidase [Prochlorococcus]
MQLSFTASNTFINSSIQLNVTIAGILFYISIYDIFNQRIPKFLVEICILNIILTCILRPLNINQELIIKHVIASITSFGVMQLISIISHKTTNKTLLGSGDAKLASLGGAILGLNGIWTAIAFAFIAAGIFSVVGQLTGLLKRWQPFPFAPFICIGIQSVWILGNDFWLVDGFVR